MQICSDQSVPWAWGPYEGCCAIHHLLHYPGGSLGSLRSVPSPGGLTCTLGLLQMRLERAEWGSDLPSVETQLETQRHIHSSVEELGSSVKEARLYEVWQHWTACMGG